MKSVANPGNIDGQQSNLLSTYAGLLHLVDEYVYILNIERVIIDNYQPAGLEALLPTDDFLHKYIAHVPVPAKILDEVCVMLNAVAGGDNTPSGSFTLNIGDNEKAYTLRVSSLFSAGALQGFAIIVKDVTEEVIKEKRFSSILDKYNLAVKSANFGIWEFNYLTKEFYWDDVMHDFFNCRLTTIQEFKNWLRLVNPGDIDNLVKCFVKALKTGADFHGEFSVNVDGATKYIETFASFYYNSEAKWSEKVTGIAMDVTQKKQAELALRESEEHYRMLAENSMDIIVFHQADGSVSYLSPSSTRVLGHTLEEAREKGGMLYVHPDDLPTVIQNNNAAFNGEEISGPYECRIQHQNGNWINFEITNKAVYNSEGIVTGIVSSARDITARKTAEEHYRLLADNIMDIIILHLVDGSIEYLSPSATRLLGVTPENAKENGGLAFVHPDDVSLVLLNNKHTLQGQQHAQPYTCRLKHIDGRWIPFELLNKAICNNNGEVTAILSTGRDISKRKTAEDHYRMLAENISDIVGLINLKGEFEYISPSVQHLIGYSPEELVGSSPFGIIHPDDVAPLVQNTIDNNLAGEEGYYKGYRVKHKNGNWVYFEVVSKPVYDAGGNITHFLKSSRNITQRIQAEQARNIIEQQYKMLADNIVDLVVLLSADFKRLYVSPSVTALLGFTPEEFLIKNPAETIHPDDVDKYFTTLHNSIFKDEGQVTLAYRVLHKNGTVLYVESIKKAIRNTAGELTNILSTTRDITKQREAEIARNASDEHYRLLADNIGDFITLLTPQYKRLYVSPSGTVLTGYTTTELLNSTVKELMHPEDLPGFLSTISNTVFKGESQVTTKARILQKNGNTIYAECTMKGIRNTQGELINLLATIRDITKQHEAEVARRASEEQYRLLADNIGDYVVLTTADFKRLYVSPSGTTLTGFTTEELLRSSIKNLLHPDDAPHFFDALKNTIFKGENQVVLTGRIIRKDGRCIYTESVVKAIRDNDGKLVNILATLRDITRQHEAEEARFASDQHYKLLADNIGDFILLDTPDLKRIYVSPSGTALTGYTTAELLDSTVNEVMHPDDLPVFYEALTNTIFKGDNRLSLKNRLIHKDGHIIYVECLVKAIREENGELKNLLISVRDISKQHHAEIAVRESEQKYRLLADNIIDLILLVKPDFSRLYVSPSCYIVTGYTSEEYERTTVGDIVYQEDLTYLFETLKKTIHAGEDYVVLSLRLIRKDGRLIHVESIARGIRNENGTLTSILFTIKNIDNQRKAELALRNSEAQYRMLADNMSDMITLTGADFSRLYVSPSCLQLTGYTADELIGQPAISLIHPGDIEQVRQTLQRNVAEGINTFTCNYRGHHKTGKQGYVSSVITVIPGENGGIKHLLSVTRDITSEKLAQLALADSEEKYRLLADNIVDMVAMYDAAGRRIYVSPSSKYLLGYAPEELLGNDFSDIMEPGDVENIRVNVLEAAYKTTQEKFFISSRLRHKMGYWLYGEITVKALRDKEGTVTGFVSTTRNVTEWKKDQKALFESEQRYRLLADNLSDMLILADPGFKRLYVSPSSLKIAGYTPAEFLGTPKIDFVHKDDAPAVVKTVTDNIAAGINSFSCKFRAIHKSGEILNISSVFIIIRDDKGDVKNILSTNRDITPETNAQQALADSEIKYRLLADNMSDLVILYAPDLSKQYISPSCKQFNGYTQEEALQLGPRELVFADDREWFKQESTELFSSGRNNFTINHRGALKDGGWRYMSSTFNIIKDNTGAIQNYLVTVRDVHAETIAKNALIDSEEKYRMLADNMSDLVVLYTPNLTKLYVSPSCKQFTGYTQEEVLQLAAGELIFAEDRERFNREGMELLSAGHNNFTINHRGARKDGSWRYLSSYFQIIKNEAGEIKNILVTVRDVHAETIAKNALAGSEEKYRMLADNMFDMLMLLAPDFKRVYVSPSAFRLTGYTAEELMLDDSPLSTIYKEDVEYVRNNLTNNPNAGINTFICQYRMPHKKGHLLYVSSLATVIRDKGGNVKNIIITTRDITPEKTAQMLLANSEEKYRSLVEASENIVLMMDKNGKYLFANTIACKYVQKEVHEVVGKTIYDFFDKATADFYVGQIGEVYKLSKATTFEYSIKVPGAAIWLRNTLNPILDANGKVYAVMLSLVDLTEIKTYAEKLRMQNEELKKIAYLQSHIVRAPLANIEGLLSLMDETGMSEENRALMQLLKKCAVQLDDIVVDIVTRAIDVKHATQE